MANGLNINAAINTIIIGGLLDNAHGRLSLNSGTLSAGTLRLANLNSTIIVRFRSGFPGSSQRW